MKKTYIAPAAQVELMELDNLCSLTASETPANPGQPVLAPGIDDDLLDVDLEEE